MSKNKLFYADNDVMFMELRRQHTESAQCSTQAVKNEFEHTLDLLT